jgi:hypothetical protein
MYFRKTIKLLALVPTCFSTTPVLKAANRLWVQLQTPTVKTIYHTPFIWIKTWNKIKIVFSCAVILQMEGLFSITLGFAAMDELKVCHQCPKKEINKKLCKPVKSVELKIVNTNQFGAVSQPDVSRQLQIKQQNG